MAVAKADPTIRRLATIPGVGGLTAHAIVAAIGDGGQFASSRGFAAWYGLTPRGASSGLRRRDSGISRQGDIRLRKLLALGASTVIGNARSRADRFTAASSPAVRSRSRCWRRPPGHRYSAAFLVERRGDRVEAGGSSRSAGT
jgi:transposase